MSTKNKVSTKFEISKTELEETLNMRLDELKSEIFSSIDMKLSTINSNKADIIKWQPLKSPEKYYHASQFTKNPSFVSLEGGTLLQIQKWLDAILSGFCQYLSSNKSWTA